MIVIDGLSEVGWIGPWGPHTGDPTRLEQQRILRERCPELAKALEEVPRGRATIHARALEETAEA